MKKDFWFEHRKFWRNRKNLAVILLTAVALLGLVLFNTYRDHNYWGMFGIRYPELGEERSQLVIREVKPLRRRMQALNLGTNEDTKTLEEMEETYDFYHDHDLLIYQQSMVARDYDKSRAQERIELAIRSDQHLLNGLEKGYSYLDETPAGIQQRLLINQHLLEENQEPIRTPYTMTGTNFLYQLFSYPWLLIVLVGLCLLNLDIFSGDFDGGAYKVLFSQPYRRQKIYGVKYLVNFLNSFVIVTGLILLCFVVVSLINGLGDTAYPAEYFSQSYRSLSIETPHIPGDLSFVAWGGYMLRAFPLYFVLCCFIIAVIGTASLLLKNTANTLSCFISLLFLDIVFRAIFVNESLFYKLWPFTPLSLNEVLQGSFSLTALAFLILLGILTVILLTAGLITLQKQDLTGGISR